MATPTLDRIKRTQRDYSLVFTLQVAAVVGKTQIIDGIQGRYTLLTWLKKDAKLDWTQPMRLTMSKITKAKYTPA